MVSEKQPEDAFTHSRLGERLIGQLCLTCAFESGGKNHGMNMSLLRWAKCDKCSRTRTVIAPHHVGLDNHGKAIEQQEWNDVPPVHPC